MKSPWNIIRHLDFWAMAVQKDGDGGDGGGDGGSDSNDGGTYSGSEDALADAGYTVSDDGNSVYGSDGGQVAGQGWSGSSTVDSIAAGGGGDGGGSSSSTSSQTFDQAFAANRAAGNQTFEWNGGTYTTDLAPEPASAPTVSYDAFGNTYGSAAEAAAADAAAEAAATAANQQFAEEAVMGQEVVSDSAQDYLDSLPDFNYDFGGDEPTSTGGGRDLDADLGTGSSAVQVTADDLASGDFISYPTSGGGSVTLADDLANTTLTNLEDDLIAGGGTDAVDTLVGANVPISGPVEAVEPGSYADIMGMTPVEAANMAAASQLAAASAVPDYTDFLTNPLGTAPVDRSDSLALDSEIAQGIGVGVQNVGALTEALGRFGTPSTAPVGFGQGMVDPSLAAAIPGTVPGQTEVATNFSSPVVDYGKELSGLGDRLSGRVSGNVASESPRAAAAATGDILSFEEGSFLPSGINTDALAYQTVQGLTSTAPSIASLAGGPIPALAVNLGMTSGEIANEAQKEAYDLAIAGGASPEQAQAIADKAGAQAAVAGLPVAAIDAVFSPFGPVSNVAAGAATEALQEGVLEGTVASNVAQGVAGDILGDENLGYTTAGIQTDPNQAIVGGLIGGGVTAGAQAAQSGQPSAGAGSGVGLDPIGSIDPNTGLPYGGMDTSGIQPGFSQPSTFPGGASSAGVTVDGTATDVTGGFTPSGPTVGQIAQSDVETTYTEGTNVGGRGSETEGASSMDAMAAADIISSEVASTGGLSVETAQSIQNATGLSMQEINDIAMNAGAGTVLGTNNVNMATDAITTEINRTGGLSLESAQEIAEKTGLSMVEINDIASNVAISGTAVVPAAETGVSVPGTGIATTGVSDPSTSTGTGITGAAATDVAPAGSTEVSTDVATDATTEVGPAIDVTTDPNVVDSTATEISGAIPGSTSTSTSTSTAPSTTTSTVTSVNVDEPEEEEEEVIIEDEPVVEAPDDVDDVDDVDDEGEMDIQVPPVDGVCPEGYTMVEGPDGPMCEKTVSAQMQRAGAGTRAYTGLAGNIGRTGPGQRRRVTTSTQRVRPTVSSE